MSRRVILGLVVVTVAVAVYRLWPQAVSDADDLLTFRPPNAAERLAAIGDLSQLDPILQRAFEPSQDFLPIPNPGPNDWLTHHLEGGQTYPRYLREQPNRPDHERSIIYLQPIGEFADDESKRLELIREFTETYFGLETKLLSNLPLNERQFTPRVNSRTERTQLCSSEIIQWLEPQLPPDAFCLLGVLVTDIYFGGLNYVFGQATLRGRIGVYSFARFDPAFFDDPRPDDVETLILRRSCRTLAHETCHLFGMPHCIHFSCLVNGHKNLEESDSGPLHLCPVCLRKLATSVGFDPIERDEKLLSYYRRVGLTAVADWTEGRLRRITRSRSEGSLKR